MASYRGAARKSEGWIFKVDAFETDDIRLTEKEALELARSAKPLSEVV
jgi:hypothetical protein